MNTPLNNYSVSTPEIFSEPLQKANTKELKGRNSKKNSIESQLKRRRKKRRQEVVNERVQEDVKKPNKLIITPVTVTEEGK